MKIIITIIIIAITNISFQVNNYFPYISQSLQTNYKKFCPNFNANYSESTFLVRIFSVIIVFERRHETWKLRKNFIILNENSLNLFSHLIFFWKLINVKEQFRIHFVSTKKCNKNYLYIFNTSKNFLKVFWSLPKKKITRNST